MKKDLFLPIRRRWKLWASVLAALFLFLVSGALLSREVSRSREEIDRAYGEMTIDFRLGPGRTAYGSTFTLRAFQLGEILKMDWYENLRATTGVTGWVWWAVSTGETGENGFPVYEYYSKTIRVIWTADPAAEYGEPSEGQYGEGFACSPALAKQMDVTVGKQFPISWMYNSAPSEAEREANDDLRYLKAISSGIPDDVVVCPWTTFERYVRNMDRFKNNLPIESMTFTVRPERNREIRELADTIQKTVNTPSPYDRNKFVAVYYNETEIKGTMDPLERRQASAVFFEKLFRILLPSAVHILEAVAVLFLANEFGVQRLLGREAASVFLSLWLPVGILLLSGYALTALLLALSGFGAYVGWGTALLHLALSLGLTAVLSALLCVLDPLTLLKERNDD